MRPPRAAAWLASHSTRRERVGVPAMAAFGVVSVLATSSAWHRIAVGVCFVVAEVAILTARRVATRPGQVAIVTAGVAGLVAFFLAPKGIAEAPVFAASSLFPQHFAGRARQVLLTLASVAFGASVWAVTGSFIGLLAGLGVWFFAERTLEHAELVAERDRAVALLAEVEASRDAATRAAASEERGRIAREMHDVLAHSLAGLSLQLQAVRALAARHGVVPEVTEPLDRAAELARDGVAEARAAVGVLRQSDERGIEAVAALVDRFPGASTLVVDGEERTVDPAVGHAVYRAVQEGLTNAARYATGSAVSVSLSWGSRELAVKIADTGRPAGRAPSGIHGSGTGLAGMAERLEALGGHLHAGALGAGWVVELTVPLAVTSERTPS